MREIKIWLDDLRPAPGKDWIHVTNRRDLSYVLVALRRCEREIDVMSFDHDLGENEPDGYAIIKWLSEWWPDEYPQMVLVHSANPVGAENIRRFDECWRREGQ